MRTLAAVILSAALSAFTLRAEDAPRQVKIGFISDLSGIASAWGTDARRGAELAAAEHSAALVVGDHKFRPVDALSEAEKMLSFDKVDALFVEFSPTAIAASEASKKARVLMITNAAAVSHLASNPYAFKTYLDYEAGCAAIARKWKEKGLTRFGMLRASAEFGELCHDGAASEVGAPITMDYQVGNGVDTQVLALKRAGVEALFDAGLTQDLDNALTAMARLNWRVPIGNSETDTISGDMLAKHAPALEGAALFGFQAVGEPFLARFDERKMKRPVDASAAALAYVHVGQLIDAVSKCPSRDIDCEVKALASDGPDRTVGFLGWHDRRAQYQWKLSEWHAG